MEERFLKRQYLYFCTSKASKWSTSQVEELVLKSAAHAQQVKPLLTKPLCVLLTKTLPKSAAHAQQVKPLLSMLLTKPHCCR